MPGFAIGAVLASRSVANAARLARGGGRGVVHRAVDVQVLAQEVPGWSSRMRRLQQSLEALDTSTLPSGNS
eukprot:CAMPEP_0184210524 /NCGR_PEP_ID=MMETSP0976-20121227/12657_1 /TAXON_ID=483370 /ORGANISM="non described non described, Strain CCMP2097" /LENGTH=70 /DNA_ID=CAMNT_0026515197 /DNA_START=24 /DNA_END=233 /DNA_ORIENTATION=+